MEELMDLRLAIAEGRYDDAFSIVDEMTAIAKKDITDTIGSFIRVLLVHLIKQNAEKRTTRSWQVSITNTLEEISERNQRDTSNGTYMDTDDFRLAIEKKYRSALQKASLEAFDGKYSPREFAALVDAEAVKAKALDYILNGVPDSEDES
jgi:Domain of unknown function DUF29